VNFPSHHHEPATRWTEFAYERVCPNRPCAWHVRPIVVSLESPYPAAQRL